MTIYAIATDWLARVEELWIARSTVRSVNSVQFKSTNVYCAAYYFELIIFWLDISIISKRAIGQSSSPTFEMIIKMKAEAYSLYWANGAVVLIVKPPNVHSQCSSLFFIADKIDLKPNDAVAASSQPIYRLACTNECAL